MKLALALHLFNFDLLEELYSYLQNLIKAGYRYDMYVAVPFGSDITQLRKYWPQATVTTHENRGFDIASFFSLCRLILQRKYDLVLKLHTKSDPGWRRSLIAPLLGDPSKAKAAVEAFKNPKVGMVGARQWVIPMPSTHWGIYHHHITEICRDWQVPLVPCHFIGGTVFWVRWSLFEKQMRHVDLEKVVASTNDENTLDWSWYILHYSDLRTAGIDTEEKARAHWRDHGKSERRACNVLYGRKHGIPIWVDGMIEHAYERFFGLLVIHGGQEILGV
jgi:lipopolysaccharide biosynthesis protein